MAEELSPESKLYVKEEIEKIRKEFKQDLKEAQSKATKTFTAVALIIGLLASVGVYGLAKTYIDSTVGKRLDKETLDKIDKDVQKLSDLKTELGENQLAGENGYAWIGNIKFVWGTRRSTRSTREKFYFNPKKGDNDNSKYNFNKCFTVTTSLGGRFTKDLEGFTLDRHDDYRNENFSLYFVAIGN